MNSDERLLWDALRALEEYERYTRGVMMSFTRVRGALVVAAITERLRAASTPQVPAPSANPDTKDS